MYRIIEPINTLENDHQAERAKRSASGCSFYFYLIPSSSMFFFYNTPKSKRIERKKQTRQLLLKKESNFSGDGLLSFFVVVVHFRKSSGSGPTLHMRCCVNTSRGRSLVSLLHAIWLFFRLGKGREGREWRRGPICFPSIQQQ